MNNIHFVLTLILNKYVSIQKVFVEKML